MALYGFRVFQQNRPEVDIPGFQLYFLFAALPAVPTLNGLLRLPVRKSPLQEEEMVNRTGRYSEKDWQTN
jgi:hypothetical protein